MYFNPIDINAFYGDTPKIEECAKIINDTRKRMRLQTSLTNAPEQAPVEHELPGQNAPVEQIVGADANNETTGGAIDFNGGALAFNEQQLMNELTGLKKGGSLGAVAAAVLPTLISMAPSIIDSIKAAKKSAKSGGACKFGGSIGIMLNDIDPSDYDEMINLYNSIHKQSKNVIRTGNGYIAGSGKVGEFFKGAWGKIKKFYGDNADKLKPITDILMNSAKNYATKAIDKGAQYIANKTGNNETVGQLTNVLSNAAKNAANKAINDVGTYGRTSDNNEASGSGLTRDNCPTHVTNVKKSRRTAKKLNVSTDPNNPVSTVKARKLVY